MKTTDRIIKYRIEPYIKENIIQIILDLIVVVFITILFIYIDISVIGVVLIDIAYLIIELFINYRITIQALIDKKNNDIVTETICIEQRRFYKETSFGADRLGNSYIRFFYPKEMQISKYKLKVITDKGEKRSLRGIMSFRRSFRFYVFDDNNIDYLNVTYLRKSKIIICFDLIDDIDKIKSKRKKAEIEKAINFINNAI